ncbi:MAG: hypothetical protein ABJA71_04920 [Ginsengibacter sp.]
MTLNEAFENLSNTAAFKEIAKEKNSHGSKYRIYLGRFKAGKLKTGAMVELLIANGYTIQANKASKKPKQLS